MSTNNVEEVCLNTPFGLWIRGLNCPVVLCPSVGAVMLSTYSGTKPLNISFTTLTIDERYLQNERKELLPRPAPIAGDVREAVKVILRPATIDQQICPGQQGQRPRR